MSSRFKVVLQVAVATVVMVGIMMFFAAREADAAHIPDSIPAGAMPASVETYLLHCGGTTYGAAQSDWLSAAGDPDQTHFVVDEGTTSIALQYNAASIVCDTSILFGLSNTNNRIISSNPNTPSINGDTVRTYYDPPGPTGPYNGYYNVGTSGFSYAPAGGFTVSGTYSITVQTKRINTFGSSNYQCVTNPSDTNFYSPGSDSDFGACASIGGGTYTFTVDVIPADKWDYDITLGPNDTDCQAVGPGDSFNVSSRVVNNGDGTGAAYRHRIYVNSGTYSGNIIRNTTPATGNATNGGWAWHGLGALASGADRTRTLNYTVSNNATNGATIYFIADVSPAGGNSSPLTTTDNIDTTKDAEGSTYTRCIEVDQDFYDYVPTSPTTNTGSSKYYARNTFNVTYGVTNSATSSGAGPAYDRELIITQGSGEVSTSSSLSQTGLSGLAVGATSNRTVTFTINNDATHDTDVCFKTAVSPGAGQSPPSTVVTDASDESEETCITIYNRQYNITTLDTSPSDVLYNSTVVLPSEPFTFSVDVCNTEGVDDEGGTAVESAASTRVRINPTAATASFITGGSNIDSGVDVARGSASCEPFVYSANVSTTAALGDQICMQVRINRNRGFADGALINGIALGSQNRTFCIDVAEQAYLTVNNGSVWAGGNFDPAPVGYGTSTCSVAGDSDNDGAEGFVSSVVLNDVGSYASYIVGATGRIDEFASAIDQSTGSIVQPDDRLKIANTPDPDGYFATNGRCMTDLWTYLSKDGTLPGVTTQVTTGFPGGSNRVQQYYLPNGLNIPAGSPQVIDEGERITIIVDGDVNIASDITYGAYSTNNFDEIPILVIVARGDINIANSVRNLSGLFMSRPIDADVDSPSPVGGEIDTCSNAPASGLLTSNTCNNDLSVRGVFAANDIEFRRTRGGVSGGNTGNGGQVPSEIFNFNSEFYLASPFFVSIYEQNLPIDYVNELPPVVF